MYNKFVTSSLGQWLAITYIYICTHTYLPQADTNSKLDIYKILMSAELVELVELHIRNIITYLTYMYIASVTYVHMHVNQLIYSNSNYTESKFSDIYIDAVYRKFLCLSIKIQ